jgi:hypothetical protein
MNVVVALRPISWGSCANASYLKTELNMVVLQESGPDLGICGAFTICEDGNECRRFCAGNAAQILGIVGIFFAIDLE